MPGIVQALAKAGHDYLQPYLANTCSYVPLAGRACQAVEPYVQPVIRAADVCLENFAPSLERCVHRHLIRSRRLQGRSHSHRGVDESEMVRVQTIDNLQAFKQTAEQRVLADRLRGTGSSTGLLAALPGRGSWGLALPQHRPSVSSASESEDDDISDISSGFGDESMPSYCWEVQRLRCPPGSPSTLDLIPRSYPQPFAQAFGTTRVAIGRGQRLAQFFAALFQHLKCMASEVVAITRAIGSRFHTPLFLRGAPFSIEDEEN